MQFHSRLMIEILKDMDGFKENSPADHIEYIEKGKIHGRARGERVLQRIDYFSGK